MKCSLSIWLFLTLLQGVQAQSWYSMPVYELEPRIVIAPHLVQPATEIPAESIRSAKPIDLAEVLSAELPEAALSRKSPLAGDLVLRGFTRDNVLITVDQTQTYCACPNRMDPPAFHVSSQQIESVQVRTGPFSVDQGASVGGAVMVRTREPGGEPWARAYAYLGSFDYLAGGLSAGGMVAEGWNLLGAAYYQQGGVYEDGSGLPFTRFPGTNFLPGMDGRTAFQVFSTEVGIAHDLAGGGKAIVSYGYQDASEVLYPGLLMDAFSDTMNRGSITLRIPVSSSLADEVEASLAFSHVRHEMRDSFRTSLYNMNRAFTLRGYFMRTDADSAFVGGRLQAVKHLDQSEIRYGMDLRRRLWDADNIVGQNANDMLPDVVADTLGFWTVYERQNGPWSYESGARIDLGRSEARQSLDFVQKLRGTATNERSEVLPSVYGLLSRDLDAHWDAFAGIGWATRQPDPQERYLNLNRPMTSPDWVGNPDLDPVSNLEMQSGLHWGGEATDLTVSAFHSWLDGTVYLEKLPLTAGKATSYTNLDARLYGFSAKGGWDVTGNLRLEASLAWQEGLKEDRPVLATNDVLGEIPPLRANFAAIASGEKWSIKADVQMQDAFDRIDPDLNERTLSGWTTLNLAGSYRITGQLSVSGGIDNLTGETYAVANAFVRDPFSSNVIVNEAGRFYYLRVGLEF